MQSSKAQLPHGRSSKVSVRRTWACRRYENHSLSEYKASIADWAQEFDILQDDETIYKLVGPVLLKQEKFEAESTVKGRLEFIGSEMYVLFTSTICSSYERS